MRFRVTFKFPGSLLPRESGVGICNSDLSASHVLSSWESWTCPSCQSTLRLHSCV